VEGRRHARTEQVVTDGPAESGGPSPASEHLGEQWCGGYGTIRGDGPIGDRATRFLADHLGQAVGFLLKDASPEDVVAAVHTAGHAPPQAPSNPAADDATSPTNRTVRSPARRATTPARSRSRHASSSCDASAHRAARASGRWLCVAQGGWRPGPALGVPDRWGDDRQGAMHERSLSDRSLVRARSPASSHILAFDR
jgi:hypothetical protein